MIRAYLDRMFSKGTAVGGGAAAGASRADVEVDRTEGLRVDLDSVPVALRERAQWVCWKYVEREGRWTKCPFNARTGRAANSTDPATWASFDEAVAAWRTGGYAGIGYVFAADDPFCGIDLDGCIDESGVVVPAAREIIDGLNSYTEISPSGRGVKVFIVGRKPEGVGCRSKAIAGFEESEVYDHGRFFTVIGKHLAGTPGDVEERQEELDALCGRLWPKTPKPRRSGTVAGTVPGAVPEAGPGAGFDGDDDALIQRASAAKNGERFARLWAGDTSMHGGDASAADQALCNALAFWTGKDAERMDRLFRRSGLFRAKWDEKRGARTYGQMTIEKAIADGIETYAPRDRGGALGPSGEDKTLDGDEGEGAVPLGGRDPATGRFVLSPRRTLPTAEAYLREFNHHADGRTLHVYGGLFMEWRDNRYCQVEEEWLKQRLQPWLHNALRPVRNRNTGETKLVEFDSNPTTVRQSVETIRSSVHLPASTVSPSWLDGGGERPSALEVLPCKSLNLHIPSGRTFAPTPALFTINALDFDYDPNPEPPERWLRFIGELFGDDVEAVELLQEWMGYCLTGDNSQQKMLLLVGPRRSGKGTIGRIVTHLVGAGNVAGPTTSSLAGSFGLQPLLGKSLAIVSDARFDAPVNAVTLRTQSIRMDSVTASRDVDRSPLRHVRTGRSGANSRDQLARAFRRSAGV